MADRPPIQLEPGFPPEAMYSKPITYETTIKSRRKNKVHAVGSSTNYQYTGNRSIVFQWGSNDSAVDLLASYIQMIFKTKGFSTGTTNDYRRYLCYGGIHSVFRALEIGTLSGVPIERKNTYNQVTAFFQKLYQAPRQLDGILFLEGASVGKENYNWPDLGLDAYSYRCPGVISDSTEGDGLISGTSAAMTAGSITIANTKVTANSVIRVQVHSAAGTPGFLSVGTITAGTSFVINSTSNTDTSTVDWSFFDAPGFITSVDLTSHLVAGDEILIRDGTTAAPLHEAIVSSVTSTKVVFSPAMGANITVNSNSYIMRKPLAPRCRMTNPTESNSDVTANNGLKVTWKPFSAPFLFESYFPLWLIDGLQMKLELEQPERCIALSQRYTLATDATVDYAISEPYLIIESVLYDDTTKNAWEEAWRSPEGLLFQMRRYIHEQQIWSGSMTNQSLVFNIEAISIREGFLYIQSDKSITTSLTTNRNTATQIYDKLANYYDAGINYYQMRQGANYFPPAPVFMNDSNGIDLPMSEGYNELYETMGAMGMSVQNSIPWNYWLKENPSLKDTALTTDSPNMSKRCILAANLSAYHGFMGGLYTRNNRTIYIDLLFSTSFYLDNVVGNRVFNAIFGQDSVLQIQKDIGVVVYG